MLVAAPVGSMLENRWKWHVGFKGFVRRNSFSIVGTVIALFYFLLYAAFSYPHWNDDGPKQCSEGTVLTIECVTVGEGGTYQIGISSSPVRFLVTGQLSADILDTKRGDHVSVKFVPHGDGYEVKHFRNLTMEQLRGE